MYGQKTCVTFNTFSFRFITTPRFHIIHVQNYTYAGNYTPAGSRKTRVTFFSFSNSLHYNSRTIHNSCTSRNGKLALLSILSAILFVTTPELYIIHVQAGMENSRYFLYFQRFSSLQPQNYTQFMYKQEWKTRVTFYTFSDSLRYNSRTIHNSCTSRNGKLALLSMLSAILYSYVMYCAVLEL